MSRYDYIKRLIVLFLLCFKILIGCISYPNHQTPPVETIPAIETERPLPTVLNNVDIDKDKAHTLRAEQTIKKVIANELTDNKVFHSITFNKEQLDNVDFVIEIYMGAEEKYSNVSLWLTMLSIGLIPMNLETNFIIEATLLDLEGKTLKTARHKDSMQSWGHLLFLPVTPFRTPAQVRSEIKGNLIRNVFADFSSEIAEAGYN